jgi:hypothetical protein
MGNNEEAVKDSLNARFEHFHPGPTLTLTDYENAIATKGRSLAAYVQDVSDWAQKLQFQVTADLVMSILMTGKVEQNLTGGIAAVNNWTEEQAPWIEFQGIKTRAGMRSVRVARPNTFFPWVGVGVPTKETGTAIGAQDKEGADPGLGVVLVQTDYANDLETIALAKDCLYHFYRNKKTGDWLGGSQILAGVGGLPGFIQASDRNFQLVVPVASTGLSHFYRDNHSPNLPWSGGALIKGSEGIRFLAARVVQDPESKNLEVVAQASDGELHHYFRVSESGEWKVGEPLKISGAGAMGLIQQENRNLEIVVPQAGLGVNHYFRDSKSLKWVLGVMIPGTENANFLSATIVQNRNNKNLEVIAQRADGNMMHYWRDQDGNWHGEDPKIVGAGAPGLVQGESGNLEVVVPHDNGKLAHHYDGDKWMFDKEFP